MKINKKKQYKISPKPLKVQESAETYSTSKYPPVSPEQLVIMFQETRQMFQETKQMIQDTGKQIKDTDKQIKDTDKQIKDTDKQIKESDKKLKAETERVNQIIGYVNNQWGKLVEAIFSPNCKEVFRERGIKITTSVSNFEVNHNNENLEIDLLLTNANVVILLEIKSKATIKDVDDVKKDIEKFRRIMPFYKDSKVFGAIAALKYISESDKYAEEIGFFVLSPKGENLVKINNTKEFIPAVF